MTKDGLVEAPERTTPAPGMYQEIEALEDVAKGHVLVKELIAYDFDKMVEVIDDLTGQPTGKMKKIEKSRKPCFCQTPEDEAIYKANNSDARIETFGIQLLKSTAIKYLNNPENMKQFIKGAE